MSSGTHGLGLSSLTSEALNPPRWIYVERRFSTFQSNLALTPAQLVDGRTKFDGVVSCLNAAYWGSSTMGNTSFYIGSWAKETRIRPPRDIDLYFVLPIHVYERFELYNPGSNKQSALLQEVKSKLLAKYPRSNIKGDGPVVLAGFGSFDVEVVPTFRLNVEERSFYVCDTKNGGRYLLTKPLHEIDNIDGAETRNHFNVRPLIRMMKCWQAYCAVPIKSFCLELLAIEFLDQWEFRHHGFFWYDWMCRDFFKWLISRANSFVIAPGTYQAIWIGDAWKTRAESAYHRSCKACEYEQANYEALSGDEWQKIFGADISKWV